MRNDFSAFSGNRLRWRRFRRGHIFVSDSPEGVVMGYPTMAACVLLTVTMQSSVATAGRNDVPAAALPDGDGLYADSGPGYSVRVSYPPVAIEMFEVADTLEGYALRRIAELMEGLESSGPGLVEHVLAIDYSHEPSPEGLVCLMGRVWVYAGGAHGMGWSRSWVYDLDREAFIDPVSLLGDSADFADFASRVRDSLLVSIDSDTDWIVEGTLPTAANYRALLPVPDTAGRIDGFIVELAPYQVAPYAHGPSVVHVRLDPQRDNGDCGGPRQ